MGVAPRSSKCEAELVWRGSPMWLPSRVMASLAARPHFDQLDGEAVGILDHEGAPVAERMRGLEYFDALAPELCVHRVEILDAERDVVQDLAA
jgi:hypothetical protein